MQVVPVAAALLELGVAAAFSKLAQNAVSWFSGRSIFRKLQFCAAACSSCSLHVQKLKCIFCLCPELCVKYKLSSETEAVVDT